LSSIYNLIAFVENRKISFIMSPLKPIRCLNVLLFIFNILQKSAVSGGKKGAAAAKGAPAKGKQTPGNTVVAVTGPQPIVPPKPEEISKE
jgi:hypothetical protein